MGKRRATPPKPHPVETLFEKLKIVEPYPEGVVPIPEILPGTAFFPGGAGLWNPDAGELPPMPVGGVMVLGHDFYSEAGYRRFLERSGESTRGPTWRNLLDLLARVGVPPERCFFTNAYMGLRAGSTNTGRFPGAKDPGFVQRCQTFLAAQIKAQRPRVLLTLGSHVPTFIAPLSEDLRDWRRAKSLKALDTLGAPLVPNVRFSPDISASVVALVHPCIRPASVLGRSYRKLTGDAAESAMLEDALSVSGSRGG